MAIGLQVGIVNFNRLLVTGFLWTLDKLSDEDIIIFDQYKGNALQKCITFKSRHIKFVKVEQDFDDWLECEKKVYSIYDKYNIDKLYIYKTDMAAGFRYGDDGQFKNFAKVYKEKPLYSFTYLSNKSRLFKYMFILVATKNRLPVRQFILDPGEPIFSQTVDIDDYKCFYILNKKNQGLIFVPFYELYFKKYCTIENEKENDFCWYGTAYMESRQWLIDTRQQWLETSGFDCNIAIRKDKRGILKHEQYIQHVQNARYTMIINSNDKTTFSIQRFIEAICCGCLPLIHKSCCLDDLRLTYKGFYDIINKENLIISCIDDIKECIRNTSESKRLSILNELKNTKEFLKVTDSNWIKKKWEKEGAI